jgi:hypothetical protein
LRGSRTGALFLVESATAEPILTIGFTGGGDVTLRVVRAGDSPQVELLDEKGQRFGGATIEHESPKQMRGSWSFSSGAQGVFDLDLYGQEASAEPTAAPPDQIWNREVPLGAMTLYRTDLERLIAEMESLVAKPCRTVIRATENEQIVVEPSDKYLSRKDYLDVVRVLTLSTSEITDAPLKRIATVSLNDDGSSEMVTSSPDEIWTAAAALRLEKFLGQFSSRFTGWLRRNGLNINSFILIAILIWMPDRPLWQRIVVFALGVLLIAGIVKSHRLVPFNRVYLDPDRQKKPFAKELPSAFLAGVGAAVIGALASVPQIIELIQRFLASLGLRL